MPLFRFLPCIYYVFQSKAQRVIFMRRLLYDSLLYMLPYGCFGGPVSRFIYLYNDLEWTQVQRDKVEHQQIRVI